MQCSKTNPQGEENETFETRGDNLSSCLHWSLSSRHHPDGGVGAAAATPRRSESLSKVLKSAPPGSHDCDSSQCASKMLCVRADTSVLIKSISAHEGGFLETSSGLLYYAESVGFEQQNT